jgi:ubiquinone/menaquinone biosynthesis C-methylase UbiE
MDAGVSRRCEVLRLVRRRRLKRYESISFADHHRLVMHLIPTAPSRVLDIGAGTGRDAAGFAALGHRSGRGYRQAKTRQP